MFYQYVVECWGAGIKAKDAQRLNKLIKMTQPVVSKPSILAKLLETLNNASDP